MELRCLAQLALSSRLSSREQRDERNAVDDLSALSRAPGSVGVLDPDAFDPGEISGMRSAAWILLATAALGLLAWTALPGPPIVSIVDLFLGVQLLRLRHSWRPFGMNAGGRISMNIAKRRCGSRP